MAKSSVTRTPPFVGDERFQEARRKAIVRVLRGEAHKLEQRARLARKTIDALTDVGSMRTGRCSALFEALRATRDHAQGYNPTVCIQGEIAKLFGVEDAWLVERERYGNDWWDTAWHLVTDYMFGDTERPVTQPPKVQPHDEPAQRAPQPPDAVTAAVEIVDSRASDLESVSNIIPFPLDRCGKAQAAQGEAEAIRAKLRGDDDDSHEQWVQKVASVTSYSVHIPSFWPQMKISMIRVPRPPESLCRVSGSRLSG